MTNLSTAMVAAEQPLVDAAPSQVHDQQGDWDQCHAKESEPRRRRRVVNGKGFMRGGRSPGRGAMLSDCFHSSQLDLYAADARCTLPPSSG